MSHVNTAAVVLQLVMDAEKSIAISHTVRMYSYLLNMPQMYNHYEMGKDGCT